MAKTLAVINSSQLVTLAGASRPRTGGDLRQLSIIEDGAMLICGNPMGWSTPLSMRAFS